MKTTELKLRVEFGTNSVYVFYGSTKKECWLNYKKRFGTKSGIKSFDFTIVEN
jgi:hypothetical protein